MTSLTWCVMTKKEKRLHYSITHHHFSCPVLHVGFSSGRCMHHTGLRDYVCPAYPCSVCRSVRLYPFHPWKGTRQMQQPRRHPPPSPHLLGLLLHLHFLHILARNVLFPLIQPPSIAVTTPSQNQGLPVFNLFRSSPPSPLVSTTATNNNLVHVHVHVLVLVRSLFSPSPPLRSHS